MLLLAFALLLLARINAQCTNQVSPCPLTLETPSPLTITTSSQPAYFTISLSNEGQAYEIISLANYGIINLVVTCGSVSWSSSESPEMDVLMISSPKMPAGVNVYNIVVTALFDSEFRLQAGDTSDRSGQDGVLILGSPLRSTVQAGDFEFFTFNVTAADMGKDLYVIVTEFSGSPSLFVSRIHSDPMGPSTSEYQCSMGVVKVPAADMVLSSGLKFYAGVTSEVTSTFTIVTTTDQPILLLNGVPQDFSVKTGSWRYFQMLTGSGQTNVRFSVTTESGNIDMYVNAFVNGATITYPTLSSHTWQSSNTQLSTDYLIIDTSDSHFLTAPGTYTVGIYGLITSDFTLTVSTSHSITHLRNGIPLVDTVTSNGYEYYQYHVDTTGLDISFEVTPFAGDPDLFLGCSVSPLGTDAGYPSKSSFVKRSIAWGSDSIQVPANDPASCTVGGPHSVYLAIYGYRNSSYSLVASNQNTSIQISDGIIQNGAVGTHSWTYYKYYVVAGDSDIVITVASIHGDPDLYVNTIPTYPTLTQSNNSSNSASAVDSVRILSSKRCPGCFFYIGVYGYLDAAFSILVTSNTTAAQLQDGLSLQDTVLQGQYQYYKFNLQEGGTTLQFILTPLSGDPDVLVSRDNQTPTLGNPGIQYWNSGSIGLMEDIINIPNALAGDYFIGVLGYANSQYTILCHVTGASGGDNLVRLRPGAPQGGSVSAMAFIYYQFSVGDFDTRLLVTASPSVGDVTIYANACTESVDDCTGRDGGTDYRPTLTTSTWSSATSLTPDRLVIDKVNGCTFCSYVIGIYGNSDAVYEVFSGGSTSALRLVDGRPVRDYAYTNQFQYYQFEVVTDHLDVLFVLTPFYGDPDIYVSRSEPTPNTTTYDWRHRSYGADILSIPFGTPNSGPGLYYIGVLGYSNSSYTIRATTNNDYPATLIPGVPQSGNEVQGENQYFECFLPSSGNSAIKVSLVTSSGDADLYVNVGGNKPSISSHMYASTQSSGSDIVVIHETDTAVQQNCHQVVEFGGCQVYIDVEAFLPSVYTITCSLVGSNTQLLNSNPVSSVVSRRGWDYYTFAVDTVGDLHITLTPISGDPDIYVSTVYMNPNATASTWKSASIYVEDIFIPSTDPHYCTPPCNFYIGVLGFSLSSYTIVASFGDGTIDLLDGLPQAGVCGTRSQANIIYYKFSPGALGNVDIQFQANVIRGAIEIYVNTGLDSSGNPILPTFDSSKMNNYIWTSAGSVNTEVLTIPYTATSFCENCIYIIAVISQANFAQSSFSIVATTSESLIILQDGVAHDDRVYNDPTVTARNYQRYSISVLYPDATLSIAVTPYFGILSVFISAESSGVDHPNSTNKTWTFSADQTNVFSISLALFPSTACQPTDTSQCIYYIGITTTSSEASYTILTSIAAGPDHPINLQNGVSQIGFVSALSYKYYYVHVDGTSHNQISVSASPRFGSVSVYVSTHDNVIPSTSTFDFESIDGQGLTYITIPSNDLSFCTDCVVQIAVYGDVDCEYSVLVATDAALIQLQDGVSITSRLTEGLYKYFQFNVPNYAQYDGNGISFQATAFSGDPDLYVSTSTTGAVFPSSSSFDWQANWSGSDSIEILTSDPNFCLGCSYCIGVYAFSNVTFSMLASVQNADSLVLLVDGVPQTGNVAVGHYAYYTIRLGSFPTSLTIRVTATDGGDPDLYVINVPNTFPTIANHIWSSSASDQLETVVIKGPHDLTKPYVIGVYGNKATQFSIVALTDSVVQTIQQGIPIRASVAQGRTVQFAYFLESTTKDLDINLTPLTGDVIFLVSTHFHPYCDNFGYSNCHNYTWWGNQNLNISHTAPCANAWYETSCTSSEYSAGPVYIGVFGYSNSEFSLMVNIQGDHISLISGQPQQVTTSSQVVCSSRNNDGQCLGDPSTWNYIQGAYFTYSFSNTDSEKIPITFSIDRGCEYSNHGNCATELGVYIYSCVSGAANCDLNTAYPSQFSTFYATLAPSYSSTASIYLALDITRPNNGFCVSQNNGPPCVYYVGVFSNGWDAETFSITASVSDDVYVIPMPRTVDNVVTLLAQNVTTSNTYEIFVDLTHNSFIVDMQPCSGNPGLYICDNSCSDIHPSETDYRWFSDSKQVCTIDPSLPNEPDCTPNPLPSGHIRVVNPTSYNYFASVIGTGTYVLSVNTGNKTFSLLQDTSAQLEVITYGLDGNGKSYVQIFFNPSSLLDNHGNKQVTPNPPTYSIFFIKSTDVVENGAGNTGLSYVLETPCGLQQFVKDHPTTASGNMQAVSDYNAFISSQQVISGLEPNTAYEINVVATCDSTCNVGGSVKQIAYRSITVKTAALPSRGGRMSWPVIISISVALVVVIVIAIYMYRRLKKVEKKLAYEMTDVRNIAASGISPDSVQTAKSRFGGVNAYSSLLEEGNSISPDYSPVKEKPTTGVRNPIV